MLAYMHLVVREAQKFGGTGWITYDQVFRRNRPGPGPSLHIAYIASQADAPISPCAICSELDHTTEDCALSAVTPATRKASAVPLVARDMAHGGPSCPKCQPQPRAPASKRICQSWNRGKCAFPGACNFQHICATCRGQHPAHDCPQTPPDSGYRQLRPSQSQAQIPAGPKEGQ